jgi:transposase
VEADESYFGGVRKGKRGRGAAGKIAVFGLLKRGGKVYTAIIPNAKTETPLPIIKEKVQPDSMVCTDSFKAYNALDVSDFHHSGLTTPPYLQKRESSSIELKTSGTRRSVI